MVCQASQLLANIDTKTSTRILKRVKGLSHSFFSSVHENLVDSLIIETEIQLDLEAQIVEKIKENQTTKGKVLHLFDAVRSQIAVDRDAAKKFLKVLINFEESPNLAAAVQNIITKYFEEAHHKGNHAQDNTTTPIHEGEPCILIVVMISIILLISVLLSMTYGNGGDVSSNNTTPTSTQGFPVAVFKPVPMNSTKSTNNMNVNSSRQLSNTSTAVILPIEATSLPTTSLSTSHPLRKFIRPKRRKVHVTVESYTDYEEYIRSVPSIGDVIARIYIRHPMKWPIGVTMTGADKIRKIYLGGNIEMEKITSILHQTTNATHLILNNRSGKLCRWNQGRSSGNIIAPVHLGNLKVIITEHFTSGCDGIYSEWAKRLNTSHVQGIALKKGEIDDINSVWLEEILRNNWRSLTHLKFQETQLTSDDPFFGSGLSGVLRNVENIYLDYPSDYVSTRFCRSMPNITTLTSKKGYLQLEQLSRLTGCKKLTNLTTSLKLESTNFDAKNFSNHFKSMVDVNMTLIHSNCDNPYISSTEKILTLEGIGELPETLWNFGIRSKCRILLAPGQSLRNGAYRDELRSSQRGFYIFNYNVKKEFR